MKLDVKNPQLFARFLEGSLPGKLHWGLDFQGVSIGKEKIKAWFKRRYHALPRPGDFGQLSKWFFHGFFRCLTLGVWGLRRVRNGNSLDEGGGTWWELRKSKARKS